MIQALQVLLMVLLGLSAMQVARTRDPLLQAITVGFYGLVLSLIFFLYQAPPLMILLTLAKVKRDQRRREAAK
jgi:energy-converting hydrogenase B subunit D